MIDPIHSLAFSIQANRGVFAVLVGSGLSRSAKIPTGWEVTLDLTRKLACLYGETCDPEPELWYQKKFGREIDYSELLDELAQTSAERQQLLREYWEPNDREREEGEKEPTAAHRALATLVARGFIRVIITTNFDRLLETALADEEVVPTVLSTSDQIQGALPLIHTRCCVLKVNGDYLDTRIRNTSAELNQYPCEIDCLLARIFDEFGLIVCGWSAEWDRALRRAIYRAPSRRFSIYWAAKGEPEHQAQKLIDHRGAIVILIKDADSFFQDIEQLVASIEEYSKPHPLSIESAVISLKRFISERKYRIQLSDIINNTVEPIVGIISKDAFIKPSSPYLTSESVTTCLRSYEATCATLLAMASVGGYWAEKEHYPVWEGVLRRLSSEISNHHTSLWSKLQHYPSMLVLYALGLGAAEANRLHLLRCLFSTTIRREYQKDVRAVEILPPYCWLRSYSTSNQANVMNMLEGMSGRRFPLNDWIHQALWSHAKRIIPNKNRYTLVFDKLEILMALSYGYYKSERSSNSYWIPYGSFVIRADNRQLFFQEIRESISEHKDDSPSVKCRIFGASAEECQHQITALQGFVSQVIRGH